MRCTRAPQRPAGLIRLPVGPCIWTEAPGAERPGPRNWARPTEADDNETGYAAHVQGAASGRGMERVPVLSAGPGAGRQREAQTGPRGLAFIGPR